MFVGSCVTVGSGFGSNGAHLELLEHGGQTVACAFGRWVWPPARLPLFLLAGARPRSPAPSPAWLRRFTLPGQKIPKFSPDSPEKAFNPSRIESRASSTTQRLQGGVLNRPLGSDCFLARAPDLRGPRGCPPVAGKPRGHRQSTWFLHDGHIRVQCFQRSRSGFHFIHLHRFHPSVDDLSCLSRRESRCFCIGSLPTPRQATPLVLAPLPTVHLGSLASPPPCLASLPLTVFGLPSTPGSYLLHSNQSPSLSPSGGHDVAIPSILIG